MRINIRVESGDIAQISRNQIEDLVNKYAAVAKVFHNQTYISVGLRSLNDYDQVSQTLNGSEFNGFTLKCEISKKRPAHEIKDNNIILPLDRQGIHAASNAPGSVDFSKNMVASGFQTGPAPNYAGHNMANQMSMMSQQNNSLLNDNRNQNNLNIGGPGHGRASRDSIYYQAGQMKLSIFRAHCDEDEIRALFEPHTQVFEVYCSNNRYARDDGDKTYFVKIEDSKADYAVQKLNNNVINGHKIRIEYHKPNGFRKLRHKAHGAEGTANKFITFTKMVLFDISDDCTEADLKHRFDTFSEVEDVKVSKRNGRSTGFIHVLPDAVPNILDYFLHKRAPFFGRTLNIKVSEDEKDKLLVKNANVGIGASNSAETTSASASGLLQHPGYQMNQMNQQGMSGGFGMAPNNFAQNGWNPANFNNMGMMSGNPGNMAAMQPGLMGMMPGNCNPQMGAAMGFGNYNMGMNQMMMNQMMMNKPQTATAENGDQNREQGREEARNVNTNLLEKSAVASNGSSETFGSNQDEVEKLLIKQKELAKLHDYEKFLTNSFDAGENVPSKQPPPSYYALLKERAEVAKDLEKALAAREDSSSGSKLPLKRPRWME